MDPQLDHHRIVRRDWLPAFAITWMSFTSLLVILRLGLRATSRNLGLDDVSNLTPASPTLGTDDIAGSTLTFLDHLHRFRKHRNICLQGRSH